jgi:hypothetical protein
MARARRSARRDSIVDLPHEQRPQVHRRTGSRLHADKGYPDHTLITGAIDAFKH